MVKRPKKEFAEPQSAVDIRVFKMLELRTDGLSINEIAEEMGLPMKAVAAGIEKALTQLRKDTDTATENVRQLELLRLDSLLNAHWEFRAHPRHASVILHTMERRARFLALDQQPENGGEDAADALRNFLAGARAATSQEAGEK